MNLPNEEDVEDYEKQQRNEKRRKKKLKGFRFPNRIIPMPNPDKKFHEEWYPKRNPLNMPHPFRAVLLGPPNVGKTTVVKNLLLKSKPAFKEVVVVHCDPDYTQEYDDIGAQVRCDIPAPEDWEGEVKTLVVLDDLEFKGMSKDQKRNLDRLYGFVSTHKNISVVLCAQDAFNVPPIVRRCSNLWVLWRINDLDAMATVSRKSGMKSDDYKRIFNSFTETRDSLWIDMTDKSPYPLRKNGYTLLNIGENDHTL